MEQPQKPHVEEFSFSAEDLKKAGKDFAEAVKEKVTELLHEGNIRSVTIKNKEGHTIFTVPLTYGVIGMIAAPLLAAVGAAVALLSDCTIVVERKVEEQKEPQTPSA